MAERLPDHRSENKTSLPNFDLVKEALSIARARSRFLDIPSSTEAEARRKILHELSPIQQTFM